MRRWLAALATAAAAGSAHAACTPEDGLARLTPGEVHCILNQALEVAARSRQTELTVALSDRVGNVLAVYRTGTANGGDGATVTIRSAPGASGGLEGVSAPLSAQAAIAKAVTGAYLSSSGNAFSTRTAGFIVQEHFAPRLGNTPGGPLFGVQFSQLPCGDLVSKGSAMGVGPRPSPLGLSADPGGFPLYKGRRVVGGIGVVAGAESIYGIDLDPDPSRPDADIEEIIAQSASAGFAAPLAIRADRITAGGVTLRYSDADRRLLLPDTASRAIPAAPALAGRFVSVAGFHAAEGQARRGVRYGDRASGFRAGTSAEGFAGFFVLDTGAGTLPQQRHAPRDSLFPTPLRAGGSGLDAAEVRALLLQSLTLARDTRAQIRKPDGSSAQVTVSVVDAAGNILGIARSPDAPLFGTDVSLQKARSAVFFSRSTAASRLGAAGQSARVADLRSFLGNPTALANARAFSARAIGNLHRPNYPDGIDGNGRGPLSRGAGWSVFNVGLQLDLLNRPGTVQLLDTTRSSCTADPATGTAIRIGIDNGIQIFPGGVPVYRGQSIVGAVGVSGDGVDQDDMIAALGLARTGSGLNNAAPAIRVSGLKFVQCPQSPLLSEPSAQNVCDGI